MAAGSGLAASFNVTGDTQVTASILNSAGATVRYLGSFPVAEGQSSIPWDGRGQDGTPLPDGAYTLHLVSNDPSGNSTAAQTMINLDDTPPSISMSSPATITPNQSPSFHIADSGSGLASATITVDGQETDFGADSWNPLPTDGQFVPGFAESLGIHNWSITATDNVGNVANASGSFAVANPTPTTSLPHTAAPRTFVEQVGFRRWLQHPRTLRFSVDGDLVAHHLRWTHWGALQTRARGVFAFRNYPSNRRTKVKGTMTLGGRVRCRGAQYYTRILHAHMRGRTPFKPRLTRIRLYTPCN
jgi:hypothetical protein